MIQANLRYLKNSISIVEIFVQKFNYRSFLALAILFFCNVLVSTAQPSTTIPNPYTNTDIIPASETNKAYVYGPSNNSTDFTPASGMIVANYTTSGSGAVIITPENGSWQNVALNVSVNLGSGNTKKKYLYFAAAGTYNASKVALTGTGFPRTAIDYTKYILETPYSGWALICVELPDEMTALTKFELQSVNGGLPYYIANIVLTSYLYTPPADPAPETLIEPQHPDIYSIFSDNVNGNKLASVSTWSSFVVEPYVSGGKNAYKVSWPSGMNDYSGAALFNLAPSYSVPDTSLASDYTHVHVDVWSSTVLDEGYLRLSLRDGTGNIADPNTYSKRLGMINAESWTGYDIPLSTLIPSDNTKTLQSLLFQRLTVPGEGLVYIDNIYLYSIVTVGPETPAPSPPSLTSLWGADKVTSVFSNEYTNENVSFSFTPSKEDVLVENNPNYATWMFSNCINASIAGSLNISGKNKFHIDIWTEEPESFQIKLNDSYVYPSSGYYTTLGNSWLAIDVDLPGNVTNIHKIEIIGTGTTTYYVDNIYFYNNEINAENIPIFQANQSLGKGINLGNGFEDNGYGASGNAFSVAIAKNLIDKIAAINQVAESGDKFDHIRIPVRWDYDDRLSTTAPYFIKQAFFDDVKEAVDYALANGLKVILNVHHFNPLYAAAGGNDYAYEKARFFAIWEQICNRFGYYSHDLFFEVLNEPRNPMTYTLWNELIPEALSVIRGTGANNENRPVLIGAANWGGFPHLDQLELPTGDNHLIATVHIYSPHYLFSGYNQTQDAKVEWWDTENEREMIASLVNVGSRFQETYPNVPVHVGEFGVYKYTDVDSRVLALTYLRSLFEEREFSWAYWEFRAGYGIYNVNTQEYNIPVVNALLSNDVPEQPAGHTIQETETIAYSLAASGTSGWNNIDGSSSNSGLSKTFGKDTYWGPSYNNFSLAQNKTTTYKISFKASVSDSNGHYLATMSRVSGSNSYTTLISFMISPGSEEKEYAYTFTIPQNSDRVQFSITASKIIEEIGKYITLNIRDFIIEEVEKKHEAAPIPTLSSSEVTNIFSTYYSASKSITFSGSGTTTYIKDNRGETGNDIIQIADFTNQTIGFSSTSIGTLKTLHLNAYAGSQMKGMTVKVTGTGGFVTKTFDLPAHEWQNLEVDLDELTSVSSIELSGGTGVGRKLFLDHIYLFDPDATPPEPEIEEIYNSASDGNIRDNWRLRDTSGSFNQIIPGEENIKIVLAKDIEGELSTQLIKRETVEFNSGYTYHLRFTASSNKSGLAYNLYLIDKTSGTHYLAGNFSPTGGEQEFSFTYEPIATINAQIAVALGGQAGDEVVLLSFKDIVIERIAETY